MPHPCLTCGACCAYFRVSFHWSEADPALGGRVPFELTAPLRLERIQQRMLEQGIWIRPFGKLVYVMPPYVIDDEQLQRLCDGMVALVAGLQAEDMRA